MQIQGKLSDVEVACLAGCLLVAFAPVPLEQFGQITHDTAQAVSFRALMAFLIVLGLLGFVPAHARSHIARIMVKTVEVMAVTLAIPAILLYAAAQAAYNTPLYEVHRIWFDWSFSAIVACAILAEIAGWLGRRFWPEYQIDIPAWH